MTDIDKRIDEIIKELEGAASANGYWQPEKLMDYVPEMYAIIKHLQAQVVERDKLLEEFQEIYSEKAVQYYRDNDKNNSHFIGDERCLNLQEKITRVFMQTAINKTEE